MQNSNSIHSTFRNQDLRKRKLSKRPDQDLINLVFEQFVAAARSVMIARAILPVVFLIACWATIFSGQFSSNDGRTPFSSMLKDVRPLGSLPDFLAATPASSNPALQPAIALTLTKAQKNLVQQLSALYQVNADDLAQFVVGAYGAAREIKVDPLLILAIMSIESSFDPEAESHAGAQGLMQVLTRVHAEKFVPFGGIKAAFDINANIHVGTRIIKEYLDREGSIEGALKAYVGAALLPHDGGYGYKVMAQMERLRAIAAGKPIPNIPDRKPEVADAGDQTSVNNLLNELRGSTESKFVDSKFAEGAVIQPAALQAANASLPGSIHSVAAQPASIQPASNHSASNHSASNLSASIHPASIQSTTTQPATTQPALHLAPALGNGAHGSSGSEASGKATDSITLGL